MFRGSPRHSTTLPVGDPPLRLSIVTDASNPEICLPPIPSQFQGVNSECDRFGHIADGQIAKHFILVFSQCLPVCGSECHLRETIRRKEIVIHQVFVPVGVMGVHARHINLCRRNRVGEVVLLEYKLTGKGAKASGDFCKEMPD